MERGYVSGPIYGTGNKRNRPAFEWAAARLRELRIEPVTPFEIDHNHDGPCIGRRVTDRPGDPHRYGCYLLADFPVIATCNGLYTLPGWSQSLGSRAEVAFARALYIPINHDYFEEARRL